MLIVLNSTSWQWTSSKSPKVLTEFQKMTGSNGLTKTRGNYSVIQEIFTSASILNSNKIIRFSWKTFIQEKWRNRSPTTVSKRLRKPLMIKSRQKEVMGLKENQPEIMDRPLEMDLQMDPVERQNNTKSWSLKPKNLLEFGVTLRQIRTSRSHNGPNILK